MKAESSFNQPFLAQDEADWQLSHLTLPLHSLDVDAKSLENQSFKSLERRSFTLPSPLTSKVPPVSVITEVASKASFVANTPSRSAIDLVTPTPQFRIEQAQSVEIDVLESDAPRWIVAAAQIPLLEKTPVVPMPVSLLEEAVEEPRSPDSIAPLMPFSVAADPGNPTLPPILECSNPDPELGCIRLQSPIFPTQAPPILYLIPRIDFFQSNNLLLGIDPINDGLVRPTLTLLAVPPLGPNTYILASVDGAFNRYFKVPQFNYDELRIRAGLLQRLSPTMTAEIGWTNQQLFISSDDIPGLRAGTRFLNDQAIRLEVSRRDQLTNRLSLNSIYQFRLGFSTPEERSRLLNVLFLSLNYDLTPNRAIQLALDYQFSAANFTFIQRTDLYQQLLGRITLSAFGNTQLSIYSGISFGNSTERGIDFNSFVLGVSLAVNLVLF